MRDYKLCANGKNRRTPWHKIPKILGWTCSVYAIEIAFKKERFGRYSAVRKPKLTSEQAVVRLQWAYDYLHWTEVQWFQKVRVTRKKGENFSKDCVESRVQRKIG
jgi:hypothetical protein